MSEYRNFIYEPTGVHHTVSLGHHCEVWMPVTILEGTQLGAHCLIWPYVMIGRRCQIGAHTKIQPGAAIPDQAVIGAYVFIGANVVLMDVRHINLHDKAAEVHEPPTIEDDVVLGSNACILPGVVIGKGAVVGAGAVVTHDVPAGRTVVGNPARRLYDTAWTSQALEGHRP